MFSLVSNRYERASMIVTSNKPFSLWGEIFGDDMAAIAMIDRLIHHSEILSLNALFGRGWTAPASDRHRDAPLDLGRTRRLHSLGLGLDGRGWCSRVVLRPSPPQVRRNALARSTRRCSVRLSSAHSGGRRWPTSLLGSGSNQYGDAGALVVLARHLADDAPAPNDLLIRTLVGSTRRRALRPVPGRAG